MTERRILYYAFGGGLGHVTRTLALARQLAKLMSGRHRILFNSPFEATLRGAIQREGLEGRHLSPRATPNDARRFVAETVEAFEPDVLIVDTFPRGLGGEFAAQFVDWRPGLSVLISRHLPQRYVDGYRLKQFVARHFDLVVVPGESSPFESSPDVLRTSPFLMRDADELPTRQRAADLVMTAPEQPVVLLVGSGTFDECCEMIRLANALAEIRRDEFPPLRLVLPEDVSVSHLAGGCRIFRHFPLQDCLPAASLVIASAGYNTVHETCSAQVPALLIPRRRKYDNQTIRIRNSVWQPNSPKASWPRILSSLGTTNCAASDFLNGAQAAADRIASWIKSGYVPIQHRRHCG